MRRTYVQGISGKLRQFCTVDSQTDRQGTDDIPAVHKRLDVETKGRTNS